MRYVKTAGLLVVVVLVLLTTSTAAAQEEIDISVEVNGESVSDGEEVDVSSTADVNVQVSSDTELSYVNMDFNGSFRSVGVQNDTSYNDTQEFDVPLGESTLEINAADINNDTATFSVTLVREATTANELQQVLNRLQQRIDRLNSTNEQLMERYNNLSNQNQELRNRNAELRAQINESNGGNGLPGFGAVAAFISLVLVIAGYRRKH